MPDIEDILQPYKSFVTKNIALPELDIDMFEIFFPYSYAAVILGFFVGIGISSFLVGLVSTAVFIVMIYLGMIRITPLFSILTKVVKILMPSTIDTVGENIRQSFKVRYSDSTDSSNPSRCIYAWHPHGVFCMSHFFHIGTELTEWPIRKIKGVTRSSFQWLFPFGNELFEYFNSVPNEYMTMKEELENGNSISVSVGGMREMLGDDFIVKRRRGIFKMALETGTPIVPVLSFGEQKLFSIVHLPKAIQDFLKPYDICIPIPTLQSIRKWLGLLQSPLKDSIVSVIGSPIPVSKIAEPTEEDISRLREQYIAALKALFEKENPDTSQAFSVI